MLIIQRPSVERIGEEEANRQRFAIGPLEPGFGHTLGVALRRTLLSSIPGAAVTQVRFDEALHEFTTLPGVKEDVTDIILNLKDIVLSIHTDEPVTLRLDVRGPGTVTAGDIRDHRRCRDPQPRAGDRHPQRQRSPGVRHHRRAGQGLRVRRPQQAVVDHRGHPGRLDLLADPPGVLHRGADPRGAVDQLRPAGARHHHRRLDHAARGSGLGGRDAAIAGRPGGRHERQPAGPRPRRSRPAPAAAPRTWTCPSRTWTCPSGPATA